MTRPKKCSPHRWNVEKWLPIIRNSDITVPEMECLNCGRVLAVADTSPNMRASIAEGIAKRFCEGDEYAEVHDAVTKYFTYQIQNPPPANRYDRKPQPAETVKRQAIVDDYKPKGGLPKSTFMERLRRDREGSGKGQVPESPPGRAGGV